MEKKHAEELACVFAKTLIESGAADKILKSKVSSASDLADFIQQLSNRFTVDLESTAINLKK